MVIITALTLGVLLSTSIGTIQSKAEEPVKNNTYVANPKTTLSEVAKQNILIAEEASKRAQISADKAKQEEIDRIAVERPNASRQAKTSTAKAQQNAAGTENVNEAKVESAKIASVGRIQTVIEAKLADYLTPAANVISVLNRAVVLHGGDQTNNCVYFSSEAMRRIGVTVPVATCNTKQYLSYLRANGWRSSSNIKELTPGTLCFTTNGWDGAPTHAFAFMGWVTPGNYTSAYVADNQGTAVHVRNMGETVATDAFAYYMSTFAPTVTSSTPTTIYKNQVGYTTGVTNIRTGAHENYSVQGTFAKDTKISIIATTGSFYKVSYNGKTGYVSSSTITFTAPAPVVAPTPAIIYKNQVGYTTAVTNIRTGAHVNYAVQGTFPKGTKISIVATSGSFYKVSYSGKTGYVNSSTITLTAPTPVVVEPTPATIYKNQVGYTTAVTSIRTGAHENYSVQGTFPKGTKISIIATTGSFYKVSYNGKTGYVNSSTVTLTAPTPVVVEPTPATIYKNQVGQTTGVTIIRTGAHENYSVQGTFAKGTIISIVATTGSFYKVSYNGKTGYVNSSTVTLTIYKNQVGLTTAATSIRTGAHENYSVQGTFAKGTKLNIVATSGSFYKVNYNGKTGYVDSSTVTLTSR